MTLSLTRQEYKNLKVSIYIYIYIYIHVKLRYATPLPPTQVEGIRHIGLGAMPGSTSLDPAEGPMQNEEPGPGQHILHGTHCPRRRKLLSKAGAPAYRFAIATTFC